MWVCLILSVMIVAARLLFPARTGAGFKKLWSRFSWSGDYKAALEVIGRGMSGETMLIDALGDAAQLAFTPAGDESDA